MSHLRLLLLSNSKNYGGEYLAHAEAAIKQFLGPDVREVLFVPFAGVRISFDAYTAAVRERFAGLGYDIRSVHEAADAAAKTLEVVTDAYARGAISILELLDAQNAALVTEEAAAIGAVIQATLRDLWCSKDAGLLRVLEVWTPYTLRTTLEALLRSPIELN